MNGQARLAVDIGGTFTDLALEHRDQRSTAKVLTTSVAPEQGVLAGVRTVLEAGALRPADIGIVIHGTTLATNAIIERKGARTALITTGGFRDVLAIGTASRYDQYDLNIVLPEPLVPRQLRLTVPERLDNAGSVLLPLDLAAVRAAVPELRRLGVESLAIGFLHAFVNPVHEQQAREILAEELPDVPVSISSEVSPEMREWERFSTTVANAYVQPLMARYLRRLESELRALGVVAPLFVMLSGGGLATIDTACRFPIRLVESGPAGGAIFAAHIARQRALDAVLSFDMGGTTAKLCVIDGGNPQTSRSFEVARVGRFRKGSGLPLRIPVIDMVEIGAGGGSLARVDTLGRIAVGPESAGADPGPACYGQGGEHPAVTDADLALGRYDPARFAGGRLQLEPAPARAALAADVGGPLGLGAEMAALGVIEMVDENMANAARVHAIESGKNFAGRALIAFGGGGPVHAYRVAEKLGIARVVVPAGAGVGSAIGFLRAPVAYEVVRSLYQRFSSFDVAAVNALLAEMHAEAAAMVAQGSFGAATQQARVAYMRYVGQGHEIRVPLPPRMLSAGDVPVIRAAYDDEYARFYDRPVPGSDVEVLSYAVTVSTLPDVEVSPSPNLLLQAEGETVSGSLSRCGRGQGVGADTASAVAARTQSVCDTVTGEVADWPVFERARLAAGARIEGPAIIAEDETSTLLGRGWHAAVDRFGCLELEREG